jgi:hypothetical protein
MPDWPPQLRASSPDADSGPPSRPLHALLTLFDWVYRTAPFHVRTLPSREQSDYVLRQALKVLRSAVLVDSAAPDLPPTISSRLLDYMVNRDACLGEYLTITALFDLAGSDDKTTDFIATINAHWPADPFPAARLDPAARQGWPKSTTPWEDTHAQRLLL